MRLARLEIWLPCAGILRIVTACPSKHLCTMTHTDQRDQVTTSAPFLSAATLASKTRVGVVALTGFFVWMAVWLPFGLFASWVVVMSALTVFTLIVGHGVTGAWKGALVDDRLRMSLSRLQMLAWTVIVVSAFGTIAIARTQKDAIKALDVGYLRPSGCCSASARLRSSARRSFGISKKIPRRRLRRP